MNQEKLNDKAELIRYYCFNATCRASIFNPENCVVKEISLNQALTEIYNCDYCGDLLVAKALIYINYEVAELLR